ncbi:Mu transposase C-terminal domain-containing protein [Nocardia sp. NPDC050710]|uniref:Mu transposase C-terminal domain-containing protein n=1 Tax=Nocardia sp. NPDC050710 TaxID=3157220 RepID=UPI0033D86877
MPGRTRLVAAPARGPRAARSAAGAGRHGACRAPRRPPGLRYLHPALAAYVRESVTIRYDPRDITEIRVFHKNRFLCKAVSPDHTGDTIGLKDIQAARRAYRRRIRDQINERITVVTAYLPAPDRPPVPSKPAKPPPAPPLRAYLED